MNPNTCCTYPEKRLERTATAIHSTTLLTIVCLIDLEKKQSAEEVFVYLFALDTEITQHFFFREEEFAMHNKRRTGIPQIGRDNNEYFQNPRRSFVYSIFLF